MMQHQVYSIPNNIPRLAMNQSCMCGSRGGGGAGGPDPPPPLKNHENIGFSSNTGPDPLKNHCYQANIQCWVVIGTLPKRYLMAFRWRAGDGPLKVVHGSSLPTSTRKNVVKVGPPLTKLSGSAHGPWLPWCETNVLTTELKSHL